MQQREELEFELASPPPPSKKQKRNNTIRRTNPDPHILQKNTLDAYVIDFATDAFDRVHVYAITREGNHSLFLLAEEFKNFIYVKPVDRYDYFTYCNYLNTQLTDWAKKVSFHQLPHLLKEHYAYKWINPSECNECERICFFNYNAPKNYWKITLGHTKALELLLQIIRNKPEFLNRTLTEEDIYEADISLLDRFNYETGIRGCTWITLPLKECYCKKRGTPSYKTNKPFVNPWTTTCQIQLGTHYANITVHDPASPEWGFKPTFYVFNYDIEVSGQPHRSPDPQHDPLIMVAIHMMKIGAEEEIMHSFVITSKNCTPPQHFQQESVVMIMKNEVEIFAKFRELLIDFDPDAFTGYNINNFDWWFLLERCAVLLKQEKEPQLRHLLLKFPHFGRNLDKRISVYKYSTWTQAHGTRENCRLRGMEGRFNFDLMLYYQKTLQENSYSLGAISKKYLGATKYDIPHWLITPYWNGTKEQIGELVHYNEIDVRRCSELLLKCPKLNTWENCIELSLVTGITMEKLINNGKVNQVVTLIMMELRKHNMINITKKGFDEKKEAEADSTIGSGKVKEYKGGFVMEPKKGWYPNHPIVCLDFNSLYPNIIKYWNISYDTWIHPNDWHKFTPDMYFEVPEVQHRFVKKHIRVGILPLIVDKLLKARIAVKKLIKETTDPIKLQELDAKQLAIKQSANSIYGFTGAKCGMFNRAISESITALGRISITRAKNYVEDPKNYGTPEKPAIVIYGDTDSIFVDVHNLVGESIEEAVKWGETEAPKITQKLWPVDTKKGEEKVMNLAFEKVLCPFLQVQKKRYVGLLWTRNPNTGQLESKLKASGYVSVVVSFNLSFFITFPCDHSFLQHSQINQFLNQTFYSTGRMK